MKHLLSLLALSAATGAYAQGISSDDARLRAAEFFTAKSAAAGPHRTPAKIDPVLVYTAETASAPCFYVFNRAADTAGFVIINADNAAELPILGYSDTSTFDADNLPDNFRWWLQQYEVNGVCKAPARAARSSISNLLQTQWGQDEPYNTAIPRLSPTAKRFVTGCTATSMAQVMKFYNYPETGKGSKSYQVANWMFPDGTTVTPTFEADFEHTRYDWDNMLNSYSGGETFAQNNAVAVLMYHAGVAEKAQYGQEETEAYDRNSAIALIENFKYDKSMLRGERKYFTDEAWEEIVYNELAANRPVLYSGSTPSKEGHSFVCDGYKDGLYHINWGWNGLSDGYYALTGSSALLPEHQGTGGAASGQGFIYNQAINYNIRPDQGGQYVYQVAIQGEFRIGHEKLVTDKVSSTTIDRSEHGADKTLYYRIAPYNYGFADINVEYGIVMRSKTTGKVYGSSEFSIALSPSHWGENYYTVSNDDETILHYPSFSTSIAKEDGVYEVLPAFSVDNGATWEVMKYAPGTTIPEITITGTPDVEPDAIELTDELCFKERPTVGQDNIVYSPADLSMTVPLVNRGEETVGSFAVVIGCDNRTFNIDYHFSNLSPGSHKTIVYKDLTISGQLQFSPGHVYTYQFFLDKEHQHPMNIPTLSFYYSSTSSPTTTELTKIIDLVKNGRGNAGLVHSLVNKILEKE